MTRLKALLLISIFVILYAIYYWGVPFVLDIRGKVPLIQSYIKKELGVPVDIKEPSLKMGLWPSVWFNASYFGVADKKESPLFITNPKLKIRLIPLLWGKVELAYFSCDKINADLKIDKKARFYIGNYLILKSANPKISIENSQMDVGSYKIKFKDEIQNKTILLNGDYFDLEKYNSKKYITFATNSRLKVNENYSDINLEVNLKLPLKKTLSTNDIVFNGFITNLNLADFSPYINKISKGKIKRLGGIVNMEADTTALFRNKRVKLQMALDKFLIEGKELIKSDGKLNVFSVCDFSQNELTINQLDILGKNINTKIKGKIDKISSNNPKLDLIVSVKNSRVEDFTSLIPNLNPRPANDPSFVGIDLSAVKKYGFYSDINGEIAIKGFSKNPTINGDFILQNAYVVKPLPAPTPNATVKLKFSRDETFIDVVVPTDKTQKIFVKGKIYLFNKKYADLDISSTPRVDLAVAQSRLIPIHEMFCFELGPLPVMKLTGIGNINLKSKGSNIDPHLFGAFNFKNATAGFIGLEASLKQGEGSLYFEDNNTHFVTKKAFLDNKPIKIDGKCSFSGDLVYDIIANGQDFGFLMGVFEKSPILGSIKKEQLPIEKAEGKLNINLKLKGKIKSVEDFVIGKTVIPSGNIKLLGNSVYLNGLNVPLKDLFGNIKFKNNNADFDLYSVVNKSKIYIKGKVKNNVLELKAKLDNLLFSYSNIPVKIHSGNIEVKNNKLTLYKVNAVMDSMPILVDGLVTDIFKNPHFNLYINSKPTQRFIEKYINKTAIYPLKIKGDIIYSTRINGTRDAFNAKTEVSLEADSNIYYMGSTLGDINNPIRIFLDTDVSKNSVYVRDFQYDKLISSQDDKEFTSPQLNARGLINFDNKNITLHNFMVRTQTPTDARIFNMLFKKPLIKQGLFTSNIFINGSIMSPQMLGALNFTGIDMPVFDTTIKDISLDFSKNNIDIKAKGEIFSNTIVLFAAMQNSLKPPFVFDDVDIYLGNLDVNEIVKSLNKIQLEADLNGLISPNQGIDIADIIIKKAKIKADSVFVKNLFAQNLTADFSLNEKLLFSLENFKFLIAEGKVDGNFKYNFLNSKSFLDLHVENVNANSMAEALFDLPNQIYGSLAGNVELTCNGKTHKTCMDTISGRGGFRVSDGKMPKLGSLEYLLKAANLVKSGVTGLTINGIIDLVSPLKTGEFENINGSFSIDSGIANDIQIFSKGKDLSLFLTGTYNFSTVVADLEIFGRLAKKISNILGPVGNTSLNTLFNTIPGLHLDETNKAEFIDNLNKIPGFELNDKAYRIFSVKVYGDINGDNYVQSFKWIE